MSIIPFARKTESNGERRFGLRFSLNFHRNGGKPTLPDWCIVIGTVGAIITMIFKLLERVWELLK